MLGVEEETVSEELTRIDAVEGLLSLADAAGHFLGEGSPKHRQETMLAAVAMMEKLGVTEDELGKGAQQHLESLLQAALLPLVRDVYDYPTVTTWKSEDPERESGPNTES